MLGVHSLVLFLIKLVQNMMLLQKSMKKKEKLGAEAAK